MIATQSAQSQRQNFSAVPPAGTETYLLPANWAAYFVNNDSSGYLPVELERIQLWQESHTTFRCLNAELENTGFTWSGADSNETLGDNRCDYIFEAPAVQ